MNALIAASAVSQKGPELLQAIELPVAIIGQRVALEVLVNFGAEFLLQSIRVEPEQALDAVA